MNGILILREFVTKNIGIFSNGKFIFLKINDKIIVYSIELEIPIASLDINDDIQLYHFMNHTGLFLLPSLFYYTPDEEIKYCWNNTYKNRFNQTLFDKPTDKPTDESTDEPTDEPTDDQTKFVFGILNGRVWKSKFEEKMSKTKVIECDDDYRKTYKLLNDYLYMNTVFTLFQNAKHENKTKLIESIENLIKWKIYADDDKMELEVFKKIDTEWELISTRTENHPYKYPYLIASSLFNNDIVILTTFGILIYTFSEKDKTIFLNYFYFMDFEITKYTYSKFNQFITLLNFLSYKISFSQSTLPLPNWNSFRLDGWVSVVINNKSSLLKYGVELLEFAIREHKGFNEQ
ncbi:hypothetical protein RhiirA1_472791 [Rhizophagus irregularis]|uniref:Uncharacterized protein n=1 Tax=Rhizophagus irregularis TaxID=588596 RepID=A0A2N0R1R3_9GLOM|nr:hypothetical protein RhiirA1_472791 [Rhizophagus irregularis]